MVKVKFKRKQVKAKRPVVTRKLNFLGGSHYHHVVKPRRITPRSTSIFHSINSNKPVKRYWGDYDGDGVINGLDCQPRNKFKQGPQHKKKSAKIYSGFTFDGEQLPDIRDASTWSDMGGPTDYNFDEDEKLSVKALKKKQDAFNAEVWKDVNEDEFQKENKHLVKELKEDMKEAGRDPEEYEKASPIRRRDIEAEHMEGEGMFS